MTRVLDHGYVKLVGSWGTEERIIEAARMSTNGGFFSWEPYEGHPRGDLGLLSYLWKHRHTSPFEMAGLIVEVYAPIFVVREWQRHRVQALSEGLSFNEMSGRYTELPNDYYVPSIERIMGGKQGVTNKQGSAWGIDPGTAELLQEVFEDAIIDARRYYERLLNDEVSRELARLVLPVAQYTRLRCSANLWGWLHFLGLRLAPNAQWEIREYAKVVASYIKELFPRTYALFEESLAQNR